MEQFKQVILRHFEKILVSVILVVTFGDTMKIPLGARVVAVADAFDAMTTDRSLPQSDAPPWRPFRRS